MMFRSSFFGHSCFLVGLFSAVVVVAGLFFLFGLPMFAQAEDLGRSLVRDAPRTFAADQALVFLLSLNVVPSEDYGSPTAPQSFFLFGKNVWDVLQRSFGNDVAVSVTADKVTLQLLTADGVVTSMVPTLSWRDDKPIITIPNGKDRLAPGNYQLAITVRVSDYVTLTDRYAFTWAMDSGHGVDPLLYGLPKDAVEDVSRRTAKATTFNLGNNKFAAVSSGEEIFVKEGSTFEPMERFGIKENDTVRFDHLPNGATVSFDLAHPTYTLTKGGHSFTTRYTSAASGVLENEHTVAYQLNDFVTLRWSVVGSQVKKAITVEREGELPDLSFSVTSETLQSKLADGAITLRDEEGNVVFVTEQPFLLDASGQKLETPIDLQELSPRVYGYEYDPSALAYPYILDPSAGPLTPGTMANAAFGGYAWSNTANGAVSDNSRATVYVDFDYGLEVGQVSDYLKATNYGFSVPGDLSSVDGIKFTLERQSSQGGVCSHTVKIVKGGTVSGDNKSEFDCWQPDTDENFDYGGTADLWGLTFTASDINASDFGVVVAATGDLAGMAAVDSMKLTVYYSGGASPVSVSGTVYSNEGSTALGSKTVAISINGAAAAATTTSHASTGAYTLSNLTIANGDVITVYLDDNTEKAVTVSVVLNDTFTGINLYQNRLITRCDNTCSLTNANLDTANNNGDADISAMYSVSSGALTVASGKELFVLASHTFAPGAAVTATDIDINGTFTMAANAVTCSGIWDATGGTFTTSGTVTFTSTSSVTLTSDGDTFNNITFNGSGGAWVLEDALRVSGNLTITAGTLDVNVSENNSVLLSGNWSNAGTFTARSGTVRFEASSGTKTITSGGSSFRSLEKISGSTVQLLDALGVSFALTATGGTFDANGFAVNAGNAVVTVQGIYLAKTATQTFSSLTISSSATFTGSTGALDVGDFTMADSGFTAPSGSFTVSGNLTTQSVFNRDVGSVVLDGTNQTLSGVMTFTDLTKSVTSAATLTFSASKTITVTGTLTLTGTSGNLLSLRSSSNGTQWSINPQVPRVVSFVDVKDSNNIHATALNAPNSTNSLNNTNWTFTNTYAVYGTTYTEGGSVLTSKTVAVSINGAAAAATTTSHGTTGAYGISGLTFSTGDVLTLYLDGHTEKAVTVTRLLANDKTGIDLYENTLITRCDNSCSLTNSNLDTADNNGDADISAIYSVSSGALTLASDHNLRNASSQTFAPGGDITLAGSFLNFGTYTKGTETVTLTATSAEVLTMGVWELYNLTLNGSGSYSLGSVLSVANNLTITVGTLDVSLADRPVTVGGNWSNAGTFTARSGTVTFNGGDQSISGTTTFWSVFKEDASNNSTDTVLTFQHSMTQTIGQTFAMDGLDGNDELQLRSSSSGTKFTLNLTNAATADYLDVKDSQVSTSSITCTNCTNAGNNDDGEAVPHWIIIAPSNTLPVASSVSIDSAASAVNLVENTTKNVPCAGTVTDADGYSDIISVQATLYRTAVGPGAGDDNASHYTLTGNGQCVPSSGSGTTENYTCTFAVSFYADATDTGSPNAADDWTCQMTPTDTVGAGTAATDVIEMNSLVALNVTSTIAYGSVALGANTGTTDQTTTVTNTGNRQIDAQVDGYGLSDGDGYAMVCTIGNIIIGNSRYSISASTDWSSKTQLTDTAVTLSSFDLAQGASATKAIYWGLGLPASGVRGSCTGTANFTPVSG